VSVVFGAIVQDPLVSVTVLAEITHWALAVSTRPPAPSTVIATARIITGAPQHSADAGILLARNRDHAPSRRKLRASFAPDPLQRLK
jgi:hypothetical protein